MSLQMTNRIISFQHTRELLTYPIELTQNTSNNLSNEDNIKNKVLKYQSVYIVPHKFSQNGFDSSDIFRYHKIHLYSIFRQKCK